MPSPATCSGPWCLSSTTQRREPLSPRSAPAYRPSPQRTTRPTTIAAYVPPSGQSRVIQRRVVVSDNRKRPRVSPGDPLDSTARLAVGVRCHRRQPLNLERGHKIPRNHGIFSKRIQLRENEWQGDSRTSGGTCANKRMCYVWPFSTMFVIPEYSSASHSRQENLHEFLIPRTA